MTRTIFDANDAIKLTDSRNLFANERKSLPNKLNNSKPIYLHQGSP